MSVLGFFTISPETINVNDYYLVIILILLFYLLEKLIICE